jgi:arylsulfatase A-like enzyme
MATEVIASPVERDQRGRVPAADRRGAGLRSTLAIAVCFGLATGVAEVALSAVKKIVVHAYVHRDPNFVWGVPLGYLVLYAALGIVFAGVGRVVPAVMTRRTVVFLFTLLSAWTLLMLTDRIGGVAKLLLAAGLARVASSALGRAADAPAPAVPAPAFCPARRQVLAGAVLAAPGLVAGSRVWGRMLNPPSPGDMGPPPPPGSPNVLLLVLDTVRAQSLSLYGYGRKTTPNLERLAAGGVCFGRAMATAGWTLPSHASMFTGRFPDELSCDFTVPLDKTHPTLAEVLRDRGYETAGFVGNNIFCSRESGLARGFEHYEDFALTPGQLLLDSSLGHAARFRLWEQFGTNDNLGRKSAERLNDDLCGWLARRRGDRPFFAFVNYFDSHDPYLPPAEFARRFGSAVPNGNVAGRPALSPTEIAELNDAYDGTIAYLDHQLGRLADELDRQGLLANTYVIVVGDHGEHFGEHGLVSHGGSLYMQLLHVPLLVLGPALGRSRGTVIDTPVTLRDLPATVAECVGMGAGHPFPGGSLFRHCRPGVRPSEPEPVYSAVKSLWGMSSTGTRSHGGQQFSLLHGRRHYLRSANGREELYDVEADPAERRNLASTDEGRRALEPFRAHLARMGRGPTTV